MKKILFAASRRLRLSNRRGIEARKRLLSEVIIPFYKAGKTLFLILPLFIFLFFPFIAHAEEIKSFDTEIVAHRDGTMDITEKIIYDFSDGKKHGIFRDIPLVSRVGDLYRVIKIDFKQVLKDGQSEQFSNQSNNSKASIKIGNANVLITGAHTYTISYLVSNGIGSNFPDHDEIYWNITGNGWTVPILSASSAISTDFGINPDKAICFTGVTGSTEKNCDASQISSIKTTKELGSSEGLSSVWSFPKNTFPPSILQKQAPASQDSISDKVLMFFFFDWPLLLNIIIAPILFIWYLNHKRKGVLGKPTVNFDIPKDDKGARITPAEAGSNDIYRVDRDDIVAIIFDLAIRKYIRIEQIKKKKTLGIFGEKDDYKVVKLKDNDKDLKEFERTLLDKLFKDGDEVELSSISKDFYTTFNDIQNQIFKSLISRGFYLKNPKMQMDGLLVGGIVTIFFGGPILGAVLIFLSRVLNGRTKLGDQMDLKIDGLKIFLKNMKRNYKWQAEKLYIVEQMIPYAIAFGFINQFMEQIKEIYPNYNPTWYRGNLGFYIAANSMFSSMNSSFTTHAPSSSSGFGGGGFSGGGGGGGGGGSW